MYPNDTNKHPPKAVVDAALRQVGLGKCADTVIGRGGGA